MDNPRIRIHARPELKNPRMILGFSGWMDGGEVSTGAVELLRQELTATKIADIDPSGFYIYSFPASMEVASLFRPHTTIKDGLIARYDLPGNAFYCNEAHNLILFEGREPNYHWEEFSDCIFNVVAEFGVRTIYFLGSFGGVVPHTRDPRLFTTMSDAALKPKLEELGFRLSNYDGPAGLVTHLIKAAAERGIQMASLVTEIPAYLQGRNPRCIEILAERVARVLDFELDLTHLHEASHAFEQRVSKMVQNRKELADMVHKLESQYDSDYLEHEMGDLKEWLEEQGFHLS